VASVPDRGAHGRKGSMMSIVVRFVMWLWDKPWHPFEEEE
jgi:hypothetical protein